MIRWRLCFKVFASLWVVWDRWLTMGRPISGVEFCSPCTSMPRRLMKPLIRAAAFQKLSDLLSLGIKEPEIGRGVSPDAELESLVCRSGEDGWWGGLRHTEQTLAHVWFVNFFFNPLNTQRAFKSRGKQCHRCVSSMRQWDDFICTAHSSHFLESDIL